MWHLILQLLSDSSSRLHAVVAGWDYPIDRAAMYQLDTLDMLLMRWSDKGKFKPVPRPWDKANKPKSKSKMTAAEAHRKLRPHLYEN
jgi:hypothetical protein